MQTSFSSPNLLTEFAKPENHHIRAEFTKKSYPKGTFLFTPDHEENMVFIVKN